MKLEEWLERELEDVREKNLFRALPPDRNSSFLNFSTNDYLGLSNHPELKTVAAQAAAEWGTGSGASRLISGTFAAHRELEEEIARWFHKEAALFFSSGYQAGIGLIPAIAGEGILFSDKLNHACLIDGCRLSRAKVFVYRHGDMEHLEELLKKHPDGFPRWIISESLFSMEGTPAPCAQLVALKQKYGAFLLLDEAHAVGVYGSNGCGVAEEGGCLEEVDLLMGTFSKSMGSFGGFAAGSRKLADYLINKARSFLFTTALPPSIAAVNRTAIGLVRRMEKERISLRQSAKEARAFLRAFPWEIRGEDSPIVPVIVKETETALRLSRQFGEEGIRIPAIRPPTVPERESRLRISLSAAHSPEDYRKLFQTFQKITASSGG